MRQPPPPRIIATSDLPLIDVDARVDRYAHSFLGPMATGLVGLFLVFTVFNLLDLPEHARSSVVLWDLILVAVFLSLRVAVWRGAIPARWAHAVVCGTALLVVSNILLTFLLLRDPFYTTYVLIVVLAGGFLMLSTRWLLGSIAAIGGAWATVGWIVTTPHQFVHHGFTVFAACVAAAIVHVIRIRTVRRVETLHLANEHRKSELEAALASVERELAERQLAESRYQQEERQRQDLQDQLQQAQKMEAIGTLAGGVAHDINNMLAAITALASLILEQVDPGSQTYADVDDILAACRRGHALTKNLLGFARRGQVRSARLSLNAVVEEVVELVQRTVSPRIEVKQDLDRDLGQVDGDPGQMNHLLLNLAINAADAMQGRGTLTFTTHNTTLEAPRDVPPGRYVTVQVTDTGPGMNAETIEHAFEPFFTTKAPGEGTGLGLSMVYGTVQSHGGRVFIESEEGNGTTVTVQLPLAEGEAASLHTASSVPIEDAEAATILVVDDEALVRAAARRQLMRLGHSVLLAKDGRDAVEIYSTRWREIDLVILDLLMPHVDGYECFEQLRQVNSDVRVLFASGCARPDGAGVPTSPNTGFLHKPYTVEQLSAELASMLNPQDPDRVSIDTPGATRVGERCHPSGRPGAT